MTPESIIERQILAWLRATKIFAWKCDRQGTFDAKLGKYRANQNPYRIRGVSDILGLLPSGRFLAIEVKTKTGRVSEYQAQFLACINRSGGIGIVARSIEDVKEALDMDKLQ